MCIYIAKNHGSSISILSKIFILFLFFFSLSLSLSLFCIIIYIQSPFFLIFISKLLDFTSRRF